MNKKTQKINYNMIANNRGAFTDAIIAIALVAIGILALSSYLYLSARGNKVNEQLQNLIVYRDEIIDKIEKNENVNNIDDNGVKITINKVKDFTTKINNESLLVARKYQIVSEIYDIKTDSYKIIDDFTIVQRGAYYD